MALRSIIKSVPPTKAGPLVRLVGSLDFKGQGKNHPLESVDPVVLCDDGGLVGKGLPPYGVHPHAGLIAVSFIIEGAWTDMDNLNGESKELNSAGDIYAVSAGRGVAHMEKSATEGANRLIQTIVKIPQDKLQHEPEHYKIKEANLPVMKLKGGHLKVCIGKVGDMESPAKLKALPRFVIGRIKVDPGATIDIPLDEDLEHGFLYVIKGEGQVSACGIQQGDGAHVFGPGKVLSIQNKDASNPMDIYLAAGKPLNEPWVKLLGFNGFILAKDEEEAEKVMAKVGEVGVENFSFKVL